MTALPPTEGMGVANKSDKKKSKKKKKQSGKSGPGDPSSTTRANSSGKRVQSGETKVAKAVKKAKTAATKIKDNPVVSEIVAAALVATAAALKDPQKARRIAAEAGDELKRAGAEAGRKSDAFWNLALDIARRSIDSLGGESSESPRKGKSKK